MRPLPAFLVPILAFAGSCASGRPATHRSASEHDAVALDNATTAAAHDRATAKARACAELERLHEICWTEWRTQEEHHYQAERHRRLAEAHAEILDPSDADGELSIPVARVTFGPVPGLDEATLRRLAECHLARGAALGHEVPEMDYCPLVPRSASAKVATIGKQLAVTITVDESHFGEVLRRAELLVERTP